MVRGRPDHPASGANGPSRRGRRTRRTALGALAVVALTLRGGPAVAAAPASPPVAARAPGPPGVDVAGEPPRGEEARAATAPYFPVNLSFLHPISTNAAAPDLRTHLDLALLLGRVGFVDGAQLGLFTWTTHDLRGVQLGLASVVTGSAEGLQAAGAFASTDAPLAGVQLSGLFGWASAAIGGVQLAGVGNQTYGDVDGLQAAGVVNVARRQVTGVQAAGLVNVGRVSGLQIGAVNVSQEQKGLQIGIVNVARRIDGLQIGVLNVTDDLEGESLGIVPLPRHGIIRLLLWGSSSLYGNVGLKFSSRYAYTILGAALHSEPRADGSPGRAPAYAGGLTMGARLPLSYEGISLSADVGAYRLFRDGLGLSGRDEVLKIRLVAAYALAERLAPFLCAGAYVTLRGKGETRAGAGPELCVGLEL
jgi:hypothetical protein